MITKQDALTEHDFHENKPRANGTCFNWRRNGATKLWKTRPDHFQIPVKYGLYNYGYITHDNAANFHLAGDKESCK